MSAQHRPGGIVVGVDGSPSSSVAVEWAARDAQMRGVALKIVHVVEPMVTAVEGWSADYAQAQQAWAHEIVEQAHKLAVEASSPDRAERVASEVLHAPIIPTLVEMSKESDMVVVGCRGRGAVANALLGSVSSALVRYAHCPVAVIHDDDPLTTRSPQAPVVVGVDGSPTSELATEIAFDEASRRGVGLVALHAWSDMGPLDFPSVNWAPIEWRNIKDQEEVVLAERLCGWQERYPDVVVHRVVVNDRPAPRLLEQAESAQLVVVGSHGRGGFPGMLLGSVSRAVVNSARIPVIVARLPRRP
ncbi:universal stress protein [Mycolicibacillus parakoreensis]|uniref:Universal stress protein n=1 Tax=Mycolicibacillus parakoreensis TaxID=1069221 RepID=A0ABY3U2J5_9MYCO|nr:universal stress protein [Mycolicibacillus parakoreensis]MCV7317470.1 universal stress protein [Mycolicibacillus parakoreensis]ULN54188.1 universal stress protein [Mycolicibacillus parakoreensis]